MINLIFFLIVLVCFLLITFCVTGKDLFSPPMIMIMVFILSTCFAVINGKEWHIVFSNKSFILLSSGIFSFIIPYIVFYQIRKKMPRKIKGDGLHIIHIELWKIVLFVIIDVTVLYLYKKGIYNLVETSNYSGDNIQWAYRNMTSYEGSESLSGFVRILIKVIDASTYIFTFVFINNVIVYKEKVKRNILLLVPMAIFCWKTLLGGGRQDLLKLLAFCFVVLYIQNHAKVGWSKNISMKYILYGVLIIVVALPGFYYALNLAGRSTTRSLFVSVSTYVGGSIKQFDQYVNNPVEKSPFWGNECFTPILNMLGKYGIIDYHSTIHLEFRKLGETIGNVYTFFRRPLQDFGIIGMYLFTITISSFFSVFYLWKIKYEPNNLKTNLNTIIYSYLLYWIVLSSIEQYSMTIISVQTLLTLISINFMFRFLVCVRINSCAISFQKWNKVSKKI